VELIAITWMFGSLVVSQNPPTGVDRQHESREARSLYPLALQLVRDLMLRFIGVPPDLYLVRKVFDMLQLVSCINRHM
jgi:hypothetical protein